MTFVWGYRVAVTLLLLSVAGAGLLLFGLRRKNSRGGVPSDISRV